MIKTGNIGGVVVALLTCLMIAPCGLTAEDSTVVTPEILAEALKLIGLEYTEAEQDSTLDELNDNLENYRAMRDVRLDNSVPPALYFNPVPPGMSFEGMDGSFELSDIPEVRRPDDINELAFYSVRELGELIRTGQVTSVELTQLALSRLKEHDPKLHCVISLTEELALKQAARADEEIAVGRYRGPLHGIPYGAKDLLAHPDYLTTWGAMPYKDQRLDQTATVIRKLEEAGAVLVAKLTLGALAWGDVWFSDTTRNPWNLKQGSSGSSAGSASAVAAGLVPFAIGSETWGSIVSPATRCGTTGLRPTFGRVSRAGAMALSWSMDKLGPLCRTVEDCAIVLDAIRGPDGIDMTVVDYPFGYKSDVDLSTLRIGYLKEDFESDTSYREQNNATLEVLKRLGADLIEIKLPALPVRPLAIILTAEASAAFQELTLTNRDDLLVRQIKDAWPNVFRAGQLIPAVEYIQANRHRTRLIQQMAVLTDSIDLYVSPSFEGNNLLLTNLTGHPCVVLPNGFDKEGSPTSITFVGKLFDEGTVLAVARKYQEATDFHRRHPVLFE